MNKLILINGAPGSGKSTLARKYADEHPLTLVLDIDVVRGLLGGWLATRDESGTVARNLAVEMARTHLASSRDVVVPQLLARPEFIDRLAALANACGSAFIETILLSSADDALRRYERRSAAPENAARRDADALQRASGSPSIREYYERMIAVIDQRPQTVRIETRDGDVEGTYRDLLRAIGE